MKKYIFTETQMKKIVNHLINEQKGTFSADEKEAIDSGSREFLQSKKIVGVDLTDKIKKYQKMIGCEITGHMMDCIDKMYEHSKNPKSPYKDDLESWKKSIQSNKPILDVIGGWFSSLFGEKDPKQIYQ